MSQSGITKISSGMLPPDVPLIFDGNIGSGSAVANVFEIVGTGSVSTDVVGNVLTISASVLDFTWNVVTSANNPVSMQPRNGYIAKGAGVVNFVLPASSSIGDSIFIKGYGNLWTISQNALQTISLGFVTTTAGVGGSVTATQIKDGIELLCVTANLEFEIIDCIGNPTIV